MSQSTLTRPQSTQSQQHETAKTFPEIATPNTIVSMQVVGGATGAVLGATLTNPGQLAAAIFTLETMGAAASLGLGIFGALPATLAKIGIDGVFADSPELDCQERRARRAARRGGSLGAIAGALGISTAVSGIGGGLSASSVVSGVLGLGGSAVAGAALVTTVPALATLAVSCGVYAITKRK